MEGSGLTPILPQSLIERLLMCIKNKERLIMQCKSDKCSNEVTGRQVFCSDKCRKAQSRTDNSDTSQLGQVNSDKVGQAIPSPETVQAITELESGQGKCVSLEELEDELGIGGIEIKDDVAGSHHKEPDAYSWDEGQYVDDPATLDDYLTDQLENTGRYAHRTNPDLLNWGKWMTKDELAKAGLKANRVTIPGDWDYEGTHTPS